jgi:hypothetical protein
VARFEHEEVRRFRTDNYENPIPGHDVHQRVDAFGDPQRFLMAVDTRRVCR